MSEPKSGCEMFQLFPSEIWSSIVDFLPGEQLGRLKLTGSKYLWSKLTKDYTVKSLILGEDDLVFKKVPAFFKEFPHVETFVLSNESELWWDEWWPTLQIVPSTVRKLVILSGNRNSGIFFSGRLIDDPTSVVKLENYVPNLEELQMACMPYMNTSFPPTLTKLSIPSWIGAFTLPKSLRHLVADSYIVLDVTNSLELPPGLETITAYSIQNVELLLPLLPPGFQALHVRDTQGLQAWQNLSKFPKGLQSLTSISFESDEEQELPTNAILLATPSLTQLTALYMPYAHWPYLPETLTDVDLQRIPFMSTPLANPPQGKRKSHPIYALPASITRLALRFSELTFLDTCFDYPSQESISPSMFPAYLTSLHLSEAQLSVDLAKQLPASLNTLFVQVIDDAVCEVLPKGLKELKCPSVLSFNQKFINALPRSLTHLSVGYPSSGFDSKTGDRLYAAEDGEPKLEISETTPFPPLLTSVSLYSLASIDDSFVQHHIHPLKDLQEFECSGALSDLSIPLLPRRITTLQLTETTKITGKHFSDLPPLLTHLSLPGTSQVVDSDICHLPRSLTILSLPSACILTNSCIKDLPKSLTYLSLLSNINISNQMFLELPAKLRRPAAPASFQAGAWRVCHGEVKRNRQTRPLYD